jgi:hypothetical protein
VDIQTLCAFSSAELGPCIVLVLCDGCSNQNNWISRTRNTAQKNQTVTVKRFCLSAATLWNPGRSDRILNNTNIFLL